ncbi:MAG: hypothetical protein WDN06_20760 [Asticcacaulis sp.]
MKTRIVTIAAGIAMAAGTVHAQDSLANVSKASGDSVVAAAELSEAGVKVVAGAVALPFVAAGTVAESTGRGGAPRRRGRLGQRQRSRSISRRKP